MKVDNIDDFLNNHRINKINIGQSGADVYLVDNKYVLKHTVNNKLENRELFLSFRKEAQLYDSISKYELQCLPEVLYVKEDDDEVILLMKSYRMIKHIDIEGDILNKIIKSIAMVHQCRIPDFLLQSKKDVSILSDEQIMNYVTGWKSILNEHKGSFDDKPLEEMAIIINPVILWHASGECILNHGDFHMDNLLLDEEDNVIICDWQSVSTGDASNDLGFFLSRLQGDGIVLKDTDVIELYTKAVMDLNGKIADGDKILRHMDASTLIASFVFWHEYLHGSSEERVRGIYDKMVQCMIKCRGI